MAIEDTVGKHHGKGIGGALVKGAVITAAVGILGTAALLGYANVSNTSVPELWQNITSRWHQEDYAPPRPTRQPTPAVSQYQRQALEQIAAIGQKEPRLANAVTASYWANDEYFLSSFGLKKLQEINKSVAEGTYTLETLVNSGTNTTTTLLAVGKDEFRRAAIAQIVKASIPVEAEFLGVNYETPLLVIDVDSPTSGAAGGFMQIEASDWTLRNKTHETGHEVYEAGVGTPDWLTEGVAELAGIYAAEIFAKAHPQLITFWPNYEAGKLQVTQNTVSLNKMYEELLKSIEFRKSTGKPIAGVTEGFVFLYEFRQLVGQEAFAEAMGHLYDVKVVRGAVDRNKRLTDKDIEVILEQHVHPGKLPEFNQLYQQRVYGVLETKP